MSFSYAIIVYNSYGTVVLVMFLFPFPGQTISPVLMTIISNVFKAFLIGNYQLIGNRYFAGLSNSPNYIASIT
jgi:hypothetical protein